MTSPTNGTIASPGQMISITVTAATGVPFTQVIVAGDDPIGFSDILITPPFQFSLPIPPETAPGAYELVALGTDSSGNLVASNVVIIDVERSDAPTQLKSDLKQVIFESQGEQILWSVSGIFADGTVLNLSRSSNMSYGTSDPSVVTVTARGMMTAVGAGAASVAARYGQPPSSVQVAVPVTVPPPVLTLSPASLSFGNQATGTTSSTQQLTLTNSSNGALTIRGITSAGDFGEIDNCGRGTTIASGGKCTIGVTFTPTANGVRSGSLSIANSFSVSPVVVALTGTGVGPAVGLTSASLAFGPQAVGTPSPQLTVTLTNTGAAPLALSTVAASGDFKETDNCVALSPVAPGSTCNISVTFTPAAAGIRTGAVTINDNTSDSPQSIDLIGVGAAPAVSLSSASLTFGNQLLGVASMAQGLTVTNTGTAPLSVTSIALGGSNAGDFAQTNTCGTSVAAGANCTINVTFTPTATGTRTATVAITDNASGSPQIANLSGSGTSSGVSLSTTSLTFANQLVGSTSAAQGITLTNTGTGALSIAGISVGGTNVSDFAQTTNCGTSVAAGASCTINVTFTPTATGTRTGTVTITDSASGSPQSVSLSGTGTGSAVSLSTTSLTFGNQNVGTTSAVQTVTLTNTGNGTLSIASIAVGGTNASDFAQTNNCGTVVSTGASCTINMTFTPTATGTRTGIAAVADSAPGSPQSVGLGGIGTGSTVGLSTTSLTYPSQLVGSTSWAQGITLTNTGTTALSITSISVSGVNAGDFAQTSNCGTSVSAGASCTINVTFTPTATGARAGTITIAENNVSGSPQTVNLSGTGEAAVQGSYTDSFEGSTINPFWTLTPQEGAISLSTDQAHSGTQSAKFASSSRGGILSHQFPSPVKGDFSVWFYDAYPGQETFYENITLSNSMTGDSAFIGTQAFDAFCYAAEIYDGYYQVAQGPNANCGSYPGMSTTNVARTLGWHKLDINVAPSAITLSIDGTQVFSAPGNYSFDSVSVNSKVPWGNLVAYYDDFSFIPLTVSGPQAALSATSLNFPTQLLGTSSAGQSKTLTNTGTSPLSITSISVSGVNAGDFAQTNNCGTSVSAGASCTINVTFTPTATGTRAGTMTITDNSVSGSLQTVNLSGTGAVAVQWGYTDSFEGSTINPFWTLTQQFGTISLSTDQAHSGTQSAKFASSSGGQRNVILSHQFPLEVNGDFSVWFYDASPGQETLSEKITLSNSVTGDSASIGTQAFDAFCYAAETYMSYEKLAEGPNANCGSYPQRSTTNVARTLGWHKLDISAGRPWSGTDNVNSTPITLSIDGTQVFSPSRILSFDTVSISVSGPSSRPDTAAYYDNFSFIPVPDPQVALSNTDLNFANQNVGTTSAAQSVTLTNIGNTTLSITSFALGGDRPADFRQTNTCGTFVVGGASCTINVTFTPTQTSSRYGNAFITDNASDSPQIVFLYGVGISSGISLSTTSLTFANQLVGGSSAAQSVTLKNTGNAALSITSITLGGTNPSDFAWNNTCGTTVAAGTSCTINVMFVPTAAGRRTGTVVIGDNAPGSPQTISLTGTGFSTGPVVNLSTSGVTFSSQTVGTTSAVQSVTLTNTGNATLSITSITFGGTNPGDFAQTNTCGTSVAAGASCTINVTFTSPAADTRTGTVMVSDNAFDTPQMVNLSGAGTPRQGGFIATVLYNLTEYSGGLIMDSAGDLYGISSGIFKLDTSNHESVLYRFTGTNGDGAHPVGLIMDSAGNFYGTTLYGGTGGCTDYYDFVVGCGTVFKLDSSNHETVLYSFMGTNGDGANPSSGVIMDGAGSLYGTTKADWGGVDTVFKLDASNHKTVLHTFTGAYGDGDGRLPSGGLILDDAGNLYGTTIAGGTGECTGGCGTVFKVDTSNHETVLYSFTGTNGDGANPSSGVIMDSAGNLYGTTSPGGAYGNGSVFKLDTFNHETVLYSFTGVNGDGANPSGRLILDSAGNLYGTTSSGGAYGNGSVFNLDTSHNETVLYNFEYYSPVAVYVGSDPGSLIMDSAGNLYGTTHLNSVVLGSAGGYGTIFKASAPLFSLSTTQLNFPRQTVGTTSAALRVTLTNTGSATLGIKSIALGGTNRGDFAQTNTCGTSVPVGASCAINVTFTPTAAGTRTATVTITDAASSSPQTVNLTGTGFSTGPEANLSASGMTFSSQTVGTTSAAQSVTLTNTGNATLSITSIAATGTNSSDFAVQSTCGLTLAPAMNCLIQVTFTPGTVGPRVAALTFTDNSLLGSPQAVSLSGTGTWSVGLSPANLTFGSQLVGTISNVQTVTLSNIEGTFLSISSVTINGPNASDFNETDSCGTGLAVGTSCQINVTFAPSASGPRTARLAINDRAVDSPQTVSLFGKGIKSGTQVRAYVGINGNQVVVLDTNTNQVVTTIQVGQNGSILGSQHLAATPDGSTVYVANNGSGTISVIDTATNTVISTISVQGDTSARQAELAVTSDGSFVYYACSSCKQGGLLAQIDTTTNTIVGTTQLTTSSYVYNSLFGLAAFGPGRPIYLSPYPFDADHLDDNSIPHQLGFAQFGDPGPLAFSRDGTLVYYADDIGEMWILDATKGKTIGNITLPPGRIDGMAVSPDGSLAVLTKFTGAVEVVSLSTRVLLATIPLPLGSFPSGVAFTPDGTKAYVASLTGAGNSGDGVVSVIDVNRRVVLNQVSDPRFSGADGVVIVTAAVNQPPAPTILPASLTFGNQLLSTTSGAQTITLSNTGTAMLSITSIGIAGANPNDFSQTNTCGTSVAAGGSCTISVTFTPTALGARSASVTIADNASGSPQVVTLSGTGIGPSVGLSPASLTFGNQLVGTTSGAQTITLSNTGTVALGVSSIVTTGTNGGDFAETSTCGTTIAPGANCTISVTFKPSAGGTRAGSVTITDNASGGSQPVLLSGTGTDFLLGAPVGGSTSATVTAGQTAVFSLQLNPLSSFSGSVTLACSGAPAQANCTLSPATLNMNSASSAAFTVNVTTAARSLGTIRHPSLREPNLPALIAVFLLPIAGAIVISFRRIKPLRVIVPAGALVLCLAFQAACGGGGSSSNAPQPSPGGTPAGTYTLTVTGTQQGVSRSLNLTLTVN